MEKLSKIWNDLMVPSAMRYYFDRGPIPEEAFESLKKVVNHLHTPMKRLILADIKDDFFEISVEDKEKLEDILETWQDSYGIKETEEATEILYRAAIKYALGRRTYITSDALDWTINCVDWISLSTVESLIETIEEAIREGRAGDSCDIYSWERNVILLKERVNRE